MGQGVGQLVGLQFVAVLGLHGLRARRNPAEVRNGLLKAGLAEVREARR